MSDTAARPRREQDTRRAAGGRPASPSSSASEPLSARLEWGFGRRMPVILQTEASECGLACLAMLLGAHGVHTDLATLRSRHGAVPQGMTVADFVAFAEVERLQCRAVQLEMRELGALRLPAMLHWDMGHFVVLSALRGDRCVVLDPAVGERVMSRRELARHFTGVAVEAWPASHFERREEAQRISIRRLVGRVTGLWSSLWRVLALSLGLEVLTLLLPLFTQWVVDHVIVARDQPLLLTLGLGFLIVLGLQQVLALARAWLLLKVGTQLRVQWRSNVLAHLMRLPLDFFARRHLGDLMSRFDSVENIQRVLTGTFVEAVLDGLMVLVTFGLMLAYSPRLALVALAAVLLYGLLRLALFGPERAAQADRLVRAALENTHLLETLRGLRTIRLFARQRERLASWQSLMVADVNAELRIQRLEIIFEAARRLLTGLAALALLWLGAQQVMAGALTVGMLLAFLAFRGQFDSRCTELVDKLFDLRLLGLDAQRLADIVLAEAEPAPDTRLRAAPAPRAAGERAAPPAIELEGVRFRYAAHAPAVLDGLNLHIPAGQSLAIAGPSGCGKTTLVQLLLGIYQPEQGSLRVDGVALQRSGLDAWRRQVGTVMQDDTLFAGSIAENIAFFDPALDMSRVQACAGIAAVHEDIARLPMGYHSLVGDMGTALSGGQKQRILLARALYGQPRVLILDEATSQLDVAREASIGRAIAAMPLTRIVIAHRPQTLALVDRVVELREGRIVVDEPAAAYQLRLARQAVAERRAAP